MINLVINGQSVQAEEGQSILTVARKAGFKIPTLCYLENKPAQGACRVCLVEVEGAKTLLPSCASLVSEGMVVKTNTKRVREARKAVVELILSEHNGDCSCCDRNQDCELQDLANQLGIDSITYQGEKTLIFKDESSPGLVRDSGKCIKCRRCVEVCNNAQKVGAIFPQGRGFQTFIGPAFGGGLGSVACVQCGQCAAVCPVGAITDRSYIDEVWQMLDDPDKVVVVQTAPAIRAALGEAFDLPPGTLVTGRMTTALRKMGFDYIFDTDFAADLTIMEEGTELLSRLSDVFKDHKKGFLPQFSSCSPAWIKFVEYYFPDLLDHISSCKSPQQMLGAMAKTYFAQKEKIDPEKMVVVSIMPCTAKKFEAQRPEMTDSGYPDVDFVLTTRELAKMIKLMGIDFVGLEDSIMDAPLGISSGAADIFANSGGVMEAALRTVYEIVTGRIFPMENLHVASLAGLDGIKEASVKLEKVLPQWDFLEGIDLKVAVAHSLGNAALLMEDVAKGLSEYQFIEIMSCPGGCISGGGQPRYTDDAIRLARMAAIYKEDEGKSIRKSHENPAVMKLYKDFLGEPLGSKSHRLLHTVYTKRITVDG